MGVLVGARVEWHDTQGATGAKGCFRGVNLMSPTFALAEPVEAVLGTGADPGPRLSEAADGSGHAGMDTSTYPGDTAMAGLLANTNLVWCGFYLAPAPSHPNQSWMNRRAHLVDVGWGLAPLYLGQQETGSGSHHVTKAQGALDGSNACALAKKAGFPIGTVIYLDIETGGPLSAAATAYLASWSDGVIHGQYVPGAYCSHMSAESALAAVPSLRLWVFKIMAADMNANKAAPFKQDDPSASGVASAVAWQWAQNCKVHTGSGLTIVVDLDVAAASDPSLV